jgi:tryptophan synthase alpha subunit
MIILDNFRSHHAKLTTETAKKLNIDLIFLPSILTTPKPHRIHMENNKKKKYHHYSSKTRTTTKINRKTLQKQHTITNIRQKMDKKNS